MNEDNERTKTHLRRLNVNPVTVARLEEMAEREGMTLRAFVRMVLSGAVASREAAAKRGP
jgi:hypothetical protein